MSSGRWAWIPHPQPLKTPSRNPYFSPNVIETRPLLFELPEAYKILYKEWGVLFWCDGRKRVKQFVVFCPKRPTDREVLQKSVTLKPPYNRYSDNAEEDRISVQYAVIALAKQAGLGYDWDTSYSNTNPVCRSFIEPSLNEVALKDALWKVLAPEKLRYKIEGGKIVLYCPDQQEEFLE